MVKFAEENDIPYDVCGKVVVATDEAELPYLDKIFNTGLENKIEGIEKINAQQIKEHEPFCKELRVFGCLVPASSIM